MEQRKNFKMNNFKEIQQRWLSDLSKETGYPVCNRNGQRLYGPPKKFESYKPEDGSEVFVRGLSRNISEMELLPEFLKIGPIFQSRLMFNFDGTNRGFAFIRYHNPSDAKKAVQKLNGFCISSGCRIGVYPALDNHKLWIGGLPIGLSKSDFTQEIQKYVEGVVDVYLKSASASKRIGVEGSSDYAFITFDDHRLASIGQRNLNAIGELFNQAIKVDWALPEPRVDPEIMTKVTKLFLGNLSVRTTFHKLYALCCSRIPQLREKLYIYKCDSYAFINFPNRHYAEIGLYYLQGMVIDGNEIEVSWARPQIYSKQNYTEIRHLGRSVPRKMRCTVNLNMVENNNGSIRKNANSPRSDDNLYQVDFRGGSQV